jgi:hypothetical protein
MHLNAAYLFFFLEMHAIREGVGGWGGEKKTESKKEANSKTSQPERERERELNHLVRLF